jgi:putative membrane protein
MSEATESDGSDKPADGGRVALDLRHQLAADQTLLAWIRSSMALAALGFVVARFNLFLHEVERVSVTSSDAARGIGIGLVGAAALLLLVGVYQHRQVGALLASHGARFSTSRRPAVIGAAIAFLSIIAVGVYLATGVG